MKKPAERMTESYTVNLDQETAQTLEALARAKQRKPRELLRLLVAPLIRQEWERLQVETYEENRQPLTVAHYEKGRF